MKTFDYYLPKTLEEALALLDPKNGVPHALPIAGGQDLVTEMKEHLAEPAALVNLQGLPGQDAIAWSADGALALGANLTLAQIERDARLRETWPLLGEAAHSIASPQIRSQATLGGNLCQRPRCWYYRDERLVCLKKGGTECFSYSGLNKYNAILGGGPSYIVHPSDMAPALVALGAEVEIAGPGREPRKRLPLEKFFTLPSDGDVLRENVLGAGQLIVAVHVPAPRGSWRSSYTKFKERGSFDWALSAVALAARVEGGKLAEARLVLGGVAPKPWRCAKAEALLAGRSLDEALCRQAAEAALAGAEPLSANAYKIPLTQGLVLRALRAIGGLS